MLINLSDVLSDQHKTVEETVPLTMGEIRMKFGKYPIVESEPVHVRVEHVRGKEMLIYADTRLVTVIPCDRCLEDVRYEFALDFAKHVDIGLSDAELTVSGNYFSGSYPCLMAGAAAGRSATFGRFAGQNAAAGI